MSNHGGVRADPGSSQARLGVDTSSAPDASERGGCDQLHVRDRLNLLAGLQRYSDSAFVEARAGVERQLEAQLKGTLRVGGRKISDVSTTFQGRTGSSTKPCCCIS